MAQSAELRAALRAAATRHMRADCAHDLAYLDRVWANARAIGAPGADERVLLAACYLHDLVNLPKDAPDRAKASRLSAEAAAPILAPLGYTPAEISAAQHAIEAHSFSAGIPPETLEARILRDADRLDALGAIGIARAFAVSGQLDRALYDADDPFAKVRAPDDSTFALDHFPLKLLKLADHMLTPGGQRLAATRTATMRAFLATLGTEIAVE